jgi:hypothetical protein
MPRMKRDAAVGVIETYDISQRRARRPVSVDPKAVRREAVPDNAEMRTRLREVAAVRRLSSDRADTGTWGPHHEPQEAATALQGRGLGGEAQARP